MQGESGTALTAMNINGGGRTICDRPIPKRGQVKLGIVLGIANSVVFMLTPSCITAPAPVQLLL
ncbi:unnamed protein product [Lathyrus sativus]|nr:unnamed protein product [Lathyrus sativus]